MFIFFLNFDLDKGGGSPPWLRSCFWSDLAREIEPWSTDYEANALITNPRAGEDYGLDSQISDLRLRFASALGAHSQA